MVQGKERFRASKTRPDGSVISPIEISSERRKFLQSYDDTKITPETITPQQLRSYSNSKFNRYVRYFTNTGLIVLPICFLYFVTESNFPMEGYTIMHVVCIYKYNIILEIYLHICLVDKLER